MVAVASVVVELPEVSNSNCQLIVNNMNDQNNTLWMERIKEEFAEAVANKEWFKIQPIYIQLEENGFSDEVVKLSQTLTSEENQEYKAWDKKVNGDVETQMDDNS